MRYTDESKDADRSLFYTGFLSGTPLDEVYDPVTDVLPNATSRAALQFLGIYEHEIDGGRSSQDWSPSLRVSYDLTDDMMIYASVSEAFKSGGFNDAGSRGDDVGEFPADGESANFEFDEEEARAYELGGKLRLFDQRATLNFAVFRTEFSDLQVSTFQGDSFIVGNAAEAISQGIELDGAFRLNDEWTLTGSLAFLDAQYDEFATATCTVAQASAIGAAGGDPASCQQDLGGENLANAPDWSGVLALDYQTQLDNYQLRGPVWT